jgi:hypothetical protein
MASKKLVMLYAFLIIALLIPVSHASLPPSQCGLLPSSMAKLLSSTAPWYCPINGQIYSTWESELPLALVALLLAFTIAALIFMIGVAFKNDRIRNFGIGELYESTASAIIVVLFLYVSAVIFGLGPAIVVGGINPYATSINLILSTINQAEILYSSIYPVYLTDSFYTTITASIYVQDYNLTPPLSYAKLLYTFPLQTFFLQPSIAIAGFLVDGIAALYAQYYLIVFFSIAAIPAFIVPGVIFRIFFPTRALGGVMIAIGVAFYLVMPTLFAVAYYFTSPQLLHGLETVTTQLNRWGSGTGSQQNALSPTSPLAESLSSAQSALSSFWLLILFYPALIIAVSYVFITQVANFIGGASRVGGKMRSFV